MNILRKVSASILLMGMMVMLQACPVPHKHTIEYNDFDFKASNLSAGDGKLYATGEGQTHSENISFDFTVNGETTSLVYKKTSNELPVVAGDEVEISFTPSCPEQTEAYFTMPDGTTHKATTQEPTFKWTVPANFVDGMQIEGETHYETDDFIYTRTGVIYLVPLKI